MKKLYLIKFKLLLILFALLISTSCYTSVFKEKIISLYDKKSNQHFIVSEISGYKHYFSSLKDIICIEK